jgi:hypothetical protein
MKPLEIEQCIYSVQQIAGLLYMIERVAEDEQGADSHLYNAVSLARQLAEETSAILHDVAFPGDDPQQRNEANVPGHRCY